MAKRPVKKAKRVKGVAYTLIPAGSEIGRPMYAMLHRLVDQHHEELTDARIALAWCTSWRPDVDGRVVLGKCKKASDLDRELAPYDFAILLSKPFWQDLRVTEAQRLALLDHELMHATVAYDENGEPKRDERHRPVFRVRKHDIEEFGDVVDRHGLYKGDLERFAAAIDRARMGTRGVWPGYDSVRERLVAAGVDVALETVISWTEQERREAEVWARVVLELRRKGLDAAIELVTPSHVAAQTRPRVDSEGLGPVGAPA